MRRVMRIYGGKASRKVIQPTNPYAAKVARSNNFEDVPEERYKNYDENRSFERNGGIRATTEYPNR